MSASPPLWIERHATCVYLAMTQEHLIVKFAKGNLPASLVQMGMFVFSLFPGRGGSEKSFGRSCCGSRITHLPYGRGARVRSQRKPCLRSLPVEGVDLLVAVIARNQGRVIRCKSAPGTK